MIVTLTMLGSVKMTDTLDEFKRQHVENYRKAVIELIKNNTNVLNLSYSPLQIIIKCLFL